MVSKNIKQMIEEPLEVFRLKVSLCMLAFEMGQLSFQRGLVIEEGYGHVQTTQHALRVGLELWRVDVLTVNSGEDAPDFRMVVNDASPEIKSKFNTVMRMSEGFRPLKLHLQCLQRAAICADAGSEGQQQNSYDKFHVLVDRWQPQGET